MFRRVSTPFYAWNEFHRILIVECAVINHRPAIYLTQIINKCYDCYVLSKCLSELEAVTIHTEWLNIFIYNFNLCQIHSLLQKSARTTATDISLLRLK